MCTTGLDFLRRCSFCVPNELDDVNELDEGFDPKLRLGRDCCEEDVDCDALANGFGKDVPAPGEKLKPPPLLLKAPPKRLPPAVEWTLGEALPEVVSPKETVDIVEPSATKASALRFVFALLSLAVSFT